MEVVQFGLGIPWNIGSEVGKFGDIGGQGGVLLLEVSEGTGGSSYWVWVPKGSVQDGGQGGDVGKVDSGREDIGFDLGFGFPFKETIDLGEAVLVIGELGSVSN